MSFWFFASYSFNLLTYFVTLFYIWSFNFLNFDNYNEETKVCSMYREDHQIEYLISMYSKLEKSIRNLKTALNI